MTDDGTDRTVGSLMALERTGLTPGTLNERRSAARALYRAQCWAGCCSRIPFTVTPRVVDLTDPLPRREVDARENVAALRAAADPDEPLLGAHGETRMSELTHLARTSVDLDRHRMTVTGWGRMTNQVHLPGRLHAALTAVSEAV